MRIFPIEYVPQKRVHSRQGAILTNKSASASEVKKLPLINFKGGEFNYKQFAFAFEKLAQMGIKGETLFFDKKILKTLPKEQEKFEEYFNKLEQSYQILKTISNQEGIVRDYLHTKNPDINKFFDVITSIKEAGVFRGVLDGIFKFIRGKEVKEQDWNEGLDKTLKLLNLRKAVLVHKDSLAQFNRNTSPVEIDYMLFSYPAATSNALEILGEKGLVYSLNDKIDDVNTYIATLGLSPWENNIRESLIEYTNPKESKKFKILKQAVSDLKKEYRNNRSPENIATLQSDISMVTYELNEMMRASIKDPKDVLERSLIVCELQDYNPEHAKELLKVISPKTEEENKLLRDTIKSKLMVAYELDRIPNAENVIEKLNLQNSKYLPNFFKAKSVFRKAFKNCIELFAQNPDRSIADIFNLQENNIRTRSLFAKYAINYDKYVDYNPEIEVNDIQNFYGDETDLKVKKVDMNNFIKALTLGNDAGCCTKLGSSQDKSAISYAKNKMFSAIEILDGDKPVGNTMSFFAIVDNQLSFILDNIELKREFAHNNSIRNAIIKCARKLTDDVISETKIPIYLCAQTNKVLTNDLPLDFYNIQLLGNTGSDEVYISFNLNSCKPDAVNYLYKDILLHEVTNIADDIPILGS